MRGRRSEQPGDDRSDDRAASDPRILHEGDEAEVGAVRISDISVIAVAAPGDEPQIAVVPGRTRERVSSHPSSEAAAIVDKTPIRKIGQPAPISAKIDLGK